MSYFVKLHNRSVISVSGQDSEKFLQGLITNDIKLAANQAIYALLLTPQGKYLYDFFITKHNDLYLIDCSKEKMDEIIKKLSMYRLRSDVKIQKEQYVVYATDISIKNDNIICNQDPRNKNLGFRLLCLNNFPKIDNISEYPYDKYEKLRIGLCIPCGEADLESGQSFPHQYRMDSLYAINYDKGCYVGQEVTARASHRGTTIKKQIYIVESKTGNLPKPGEKVMLNGKEIGVMRSSCDKVGLALLDIDDKNSNKLLVE